MKEGKGKQEFRRDFARSRASEGRRRAVLRCAVLNYVPTRCEGLRMRTGGGTNGGVQEGRREGKARQAPPPTVIIIVTSSTKRSKYSVQSGTSTGQ